MNSIYYRIFLVLLAVGSLVSCSITDPAMPPTSADQMLHIRILNADIDNRDVSLTVDYEVFQSSIAYASLTNYKEMDTVASIYTFKNGNNIIFRDLIKFNKDKKHHTLYLLKRTLDTSYTYYVADIANSDPSKADIRFFNFVFGSPELDFRLGNEAGEILFDSIPYGNKEIINSYALDEGNHKFTITKTDGSGVYVEYDPIYLEAGKVYYISLFGDNANLNQTLFARAFLSSNDEPGQYIEMKQPVPKVLAVNMLSSADSVDVYVNGVKGASINFAENSNYIIGNKNTNSISVFYRNTTTSVFNFDLDLGEDLRKTFIAYKDGETNTFKVFDDNTTYPAFGKSKIRLINMTDLPVISLFNFESSLISNVNSKESSDFLEIEAEKYNFTLRNENNDTLSNVREIDLPKNRIITFIAYKLEKPIDGHSYAIKRIDY